MNKVKYQVFISSTYEDLVEERNQIIKACLEMGHIPVGMEMFSAADEEQWKIITRQIDDSDYYVVIVANRYGSIIDGISYTEKEYDYVVEKGIPVLGFVLEQNAPWPTNRFDTERKAQSKLEVFKKKIKNKPVNFWTNKDDLYAKCAIALGKTISIQPRPGWVRSPETTGSEVASELSRLSIENKELRDQNGELAKANNLMSYENIYNLLRNTVLNVNELPESIAEVFNKITYNLSESKSNFIYMFWYVSIRLREGIIVNDSIFKESLFYSNEEYNLAIMPYVYYFEEYGLVTRSTKTEPTMNPAYNKIKYIFLLSEEGKLFLTKLRLKGIIKQIEDTLSDNE